MIRRLLSLAILIIAAVSTLGAKTKVACVGNSITYGFLVENREENAYPKQLSRMLGEDYEVANFGHSGSTLLKKGHKPYVKVPEYQAALDFNPDVIVMHLGVNDTDPRNWPEYGDEFVGDYIDLINSFKKVNPKVRVILAQLTPLSASHFRFRTGTRDWRKEIRRAIADVAAATGSELIDFEPPFRDRQNLMPDGIHPNAEGAALLAQSAFKAITGEYGPLQMPAVYTSGMVLQRNTPLTFRGVSKPYAQITLTLDGNTYRTLSNSIGEWSIRTAPLVTGPSYTLTVTDGVKTIKLDDILAGEVWIASGQSNMEFTLGQTVDAKEVVPTANDPKFRVYDMKAVARTDNVEWSDSLQRMINRLEHYRPTQWAAITPQTAKQFSAVAYHFGKMLRDSLDVPVGIICNAVGGSPCESWIDVNTLEDEMPEILVKWRTNDYLQKWCQERAIKNMGGKANARHPYEPSYLFGAGIRPLGPLEVAGTIWYQGESNAHNTLIYEQLFPLLVKSWRRQFNNPEMPFYFVQLSGINRPSWPTFRNAQRLLSEKLPNVAMAVSYDRGDSLDVHPRDKRPVGERLALQALYNTYGHRNLIPSGPVPVRAIADGNRILLTFKWGQGMKPSKGEKLIGFELAETEGIYSGAQAKVLNDSTIEVVSEKVSNPRIVRYGWQPFTRANLVNEKNIPATTFKMEISNSSDFENEAGLEYGVSAPFAGTLNGLLIMAGGCNFPKDPLAPKSQKRYYKGIYATNPRMVRDFPTLHRIGSLPEAMAYGATVQMGGNSMLLIGGTTADRKLNTVYEISVNNGNVETRTLPALPVTIDNCAAAAIGRTVYVAGGNQNGKPSRSVWALNLDDQGKGWRRVKDLPGNPRTQPVMAATKDANGYELLYLWGGFAPKYDGKEATLETDGLVYCPKKNRWTKISSPINGNGEAVSLGGGTALTLADGRIVAAGGVNKDIFLSALRSTPEGYLEHPNSWYRFNPNVMVFDPRNGEWSTLLTSPDAARAGGVLVNSGFGTLYLIGGELKPRIRTAEILPISID